MTTYATPQSYTRALILVTFFFAVITFGAFYTIGFVPDYLDGTTSEEPAQTLDARTRLSGFGFDNYRTVALASLPQLGPLGQSAQVAGEQTRAIEPERILINGVEIDLPVLNPDSTDIGVLDNALHSGAVRYPLSARLGEEGNVFIFGHSSGLPVVRNQMFKAFNNLPDLEDGDTITLIGGGERHVYRVNTVRLTTAGEELVDLTPRGGKRLTLSTCNSFGQKSERWVVEADFIGAYNDSA